jgi:hypothetical protein
VQLYGDFRYGKNLIAGSEAEARYKRLNKGAKYAKGVGLVIDVAAAVAQIVNMIMVAKQYEDAIDKLNETKRDLEGCEEVIDQTLKEQKAQIADINKALDEAWPIFNQTKGIYCYLNKCSFDQHFFS